MIEKFDAKVFEFLKHSAAGLLIIGGLLAFISYLFLITINHIPAYNNFAGWLGITLFMPVVCGIYIFGHNIKTKRPWLSRLMKKIFAIWLVVYLIMSFILLIQWIITLV